MGWLPDHSQNTPSRKSGGPHEKSRGTSEKVGWTRRKVFGTFQKVFGSNGDCPQGDPCAAPLVDATARRVTPRASRVDRSRRESTGIERADAEKSPNRQLSIGVQITYEAPPVATRLPPTPVDSAPRHPPSIVGMAAIAERRAASLSW